MPRRASATQGRRAGYYVGGKTGTAEKVVGGRYSKTKLLTTFIAVLPADKPRYLFLIMLDEPQALPETHGYATSGWNAAPTAGKVIARIAPLLGLEPRFDLPPADQLILAKVGVNGRASVNRGWHVPASRHPAFRDAHAGLQGRCVLDTLRGMTSNAT